jgi:hypothetical protein
MPNTLNPEFGAALKYTTSPSGSEAGTETIARGPVFNEPDSLRVQNATDAPVLCQLTQPFSVCSGRNSLRWPKSGESATLTRRKFWQVYGAYRD